MTDADQTGDAADRLGGIGDRFGREETADTADTSESTDTSDTTSTTDTTDTGDELQPGDDGFRLVDEWSGRTFYLPDDVVDELDQTYKQLDLEWSAEHGEDLPKSERFYPAVIFAALDDTDAIREQLGLDT